MGLTISHFSSGFRHKINPEMNPGPFEEPTFDPLLGFEEGRVEREMQISQEEMESCKIALKDRDYCAHLLAKYMACRKDVWPFAVKCKHENHALLTCRYEDFVIRMKEYEREKRLRKRQKVIDVHQKYLDECLEQSKNEK